MESATAQRAAGRIEALQERLRDAGWALQVEPARTDAGILRSRDEFLKRLDEAGASLEASHAKALEQAARAKASASAANIAEQRIERLTDKAQRLIEEAAEAKAMRQFVSRRTARP